MGPEGRRTRRRRRRRRHAADLAPATAVHPVGRGAGARVVAGRHAGTRCLALGRRPQPAAAVTGAGGTGRALRRPLPHRDPPARRGRLSLLGGPAVRVRRVRSTRPPSATSWRRWSLGSRPGGARTARRRRSRSRWRSSSSSTTASTAWSSRRRGGRRARSTSFCARALGGAAASLPELYAGVDRGGRTARACAGDLRLAASEDDARAAPLDAYLARFGDEAPVWDVATPTYREDPARLLSWQRADSAAPSSRAGDGDSLAKGRARRCHAARARLIAPLSPSCWKWRGARAPPERTTTGSTRARRRWCERRCYVRASAWSAGGRLAAAGDVFWLPFERVRAWAAGEPAAPSAELRGSGCIRAHGLRAGAAASAGAGGEPRPGLATHPRCRRHRSGPARVGGPGDRSAFVYRARGARRAPRERRGRDRRRHHAVADGAPALARGRPGRRDRRRARPRGRAGARTSNTRHRRRAWRLRRDRRRRPGLARRRCRRVDPPGLTRFLARLRQCGSDERQDAKSGLSIIRILAFPASWRFSYLTGICR